MPKHRPTPARDRGSRPLLLAVGLVCAAVAAGYVYSLVATGNRPRPLGSFASLVDHRGRAFAGQIGSRDYKLVVFGYTNCPEVCPTTLLRVREVLDVLGPRGRDLAPLFVTLDPVRDTPPVLARYTSHFDPRIVGITGETSQVRALAHTYGVYPRAPKPTDGSEYVDHSAMIYLLGRDNVMLAMYGPATAAQTIALDVRLRTQRQDERAAVDGAGT